jgi:hypothetical protein
LLTTRAERGSILIGTRTKAAQSGIGILPMFPKIMG